jgi:hypothetical protein
MAVTETPSTPSVFGELVFEPIPDALPRPPGKGREPVKWEQHLAPLETQLLDKPARLWAYENKTGATSRMSAVRGRLYEAAPTKHWEFKVRPVPNTTPQLFGVYAVFHGEYTPEQVIENAKARQKRRDALAAGRSAPVANGENSAPVAGTEAPQTPKERLAAQAAAKK